MQDRSRISIKMYNFILELNEEQKVVKDVTMRNTGQRESRTGIKIYHNFRP